MVQFDLATDDPEQFLFKMTTNYPYFLSDDITVFEREKNMCLNLEVG